jgi:hypothetical protein
MATKPAFLFAAMPAVGSTFPMLTIEWDANNLTDSEALKLLHP